MASKGKYSLRLVLGTSKKSGKTRYASSSVTIDELMKSANKVQCQFSTKDIGGEEFDLQVEDSFGQKMNELKTTDDGSGVFLSLWHRAGVSKKNNREYSFYSSENVNLSDLKDRLGTGPVRIFVGKSKSTNPKAPAFYLLITKDKGRQGGGTENRQQQSASSSSEQF